MKTQKINKILVIFFLVNIVLLGVYGYLYYAVYTKNQETAVLYTASHQQASDKEKIQGLDRALKDTEKERNKLSEYFVSKTNAVTFIEQIENIGKSAGVDLSVSSVSDETKDNSSIQLSFSAKGSFPDMYRLIALIESMPYKVAIQRVDIQRTGEQKGGAAVWRGSFMVTLESFAAANTAPMSADASNGAAKK